MKGIRIRPEQAGVRASLFDLEADVMDVIWAAGQDPVSVGHVHERLAGDRELAYTTVMTTVHRVFDKGLLSRERDGRRYVYTPVLDKDAFLQAMAREVLASLFDDGVAGAEALLVERVAEADEAELDHLERLIAERRRARSR